MGSRFNNDDRGVMEDLSAAEIDRFYQHLPVLTAALRSPQLLVKLRLQVGEMLIVHNHRVLHGREAFVGYRNLVSQKTWANHAHPSSMDPLPTCLETINACLPFVLPIQNVISPSPPFHPHLHPPHKNGIDDGRRRWSCRWGPILRSLSLNHSCDWRHADA